MISIPVKKACIDYNYNELDGFKVTIEVSSGYTHSANTIKKLIDSGAPLEFTLKKPVEEKTWKQCKTAWAAMNEIAKALGVPSREIEHEIIKDYGKAQFILVPNEEAENIISLHSEGGAGDFGEIIGASKQDPKCTVVKLYYGMSHYNKEEMSRFIDGVKCRYEEVFE